MRSRTYVITSLLVLAASACEARRRRTPDDTLVLVIDTAMTTADPRFAISNQDGKLVRIVGAGLTAVDTPSLQPRLDLAASMEAVEAEIAISVAVPVPIRLPNDTWVIVPMINVIQVPAPAWDITLRDARFSDGAPVTAEDVAWTYSTVLAADSPSLHHKGFSERYWSVTARSPRVVRFVLKAPLATLTSDLDFAIVSKKNQLGAGPYSVRELTSEHVVLDANPYYYGPRPKTRRIEIKFVRDAAARLLMLVGGTADLIQNGVRMDLIDEVSARPRVQLASSPSAILTYLMMNNDDPLLRDRRVREAIALTIDRPSIIATKFDGRARLAHGLLADTHWAHSPEVPHRVRDLARAKQLLDDAGLPDPDGDGPLPRASLTYKTSSDAFRLMLARVIAAQLAEVGLAVEVRSFEFATFFADIKKGSYQLASMQTAPVTEPDYYFFYFHSSRIPTTRDPDGGNRWRYRSAAFDRAALAGRRELDPEQRKVHYAETQRLIFEDVPIVPLWHEDNVVLSHADVHDYAMTPNARYIGLARAWKQPYR